MDRIVFTANSRALSTRGGEHRPHQGRGASSSECHIRRIPNKLCVHPLFISVSPTNAGRASKGPCRFCSSLQTDKYCQESGERFQHTHQVNTECRCEAHSKRSSSKSRRDCQRHCEKPTGELENKLPSEGVSQQRFQSKGTDVKKALANTQLRMNRREIKGLDFYEPVVLFENFLLDPPLRHSPNLMSSAISCWL